MIGTALWNDRFLLWQLTLKEVRARYKQSLLGYLWIIANPLAQLIVFTFVFSVIVRFPTGDIPYPIFLYAGLLPWTLFQGSVSTATQTLVENGPLLRKVIFPRQFLPYSVILAKLIDFCISFLLLIGLMVIYGVVPSWKVVFVPLLLLLQIMFTTGISLVLSACNLLYRDVQYLVNLLLMLWMYLTPIVYPFSLVPERYQWLYLLNPMVGIIEGYRSLLFATPFPASWVAWSVGSTLLIYIAGRGIFHRLERVFADSV